LSFFYFSEILTLSSDDEDKQDKKPTLETQPTSNGVAPELETDPAAMEEPEGYDRKHSPGVEGIVCSGMNFSFHVWLYKCLNAAV